jgi:hypothetical protein
MKSASIALTAEQMRMAGVFAAERQKKRAPAEQTRSVGGFSLQGAKATTLAAGQKTETRVEQASGRRQEDRGENSTCLPAPAQPETPAMHSTRAPNAVSQPNIALPGNENRQGSWAVR